MAFQAIGLTETHTDEGYGKDYSAKRTETTHYQHPKHVIPFKHEHQDGKDYEDVFRYETVFIGELQIVYSYDWGNYFVMEDIVISRNGKEISYIGRSEGAVDRLKFDTRNREEGQKVFAEIAADFGMDSRQLAQAFASTFKMSLGCLALLE